MHWIIPKCSFYFLFDIPRFDNVEELTNVDKKKRQIGALYKSELPKRRKCNDPVPDVV